MKPAHRKAFPWLLASALSLLAGLGTYAHAAVKVAALPDDQAFVVNGTRFGAKTYAALVAAIKQHSPKATDASVLKGLVENHLLADQFVQHADGHDTHAHLNQKDKLWQEYAMLIGQLYPVEMTAAIEGRCLHVDAISVEALKALLGTTRRSVTTIADTSLSPDSREAISTKVLAKIACDESESLEVTLGEVLASADEASALQVWRGEMATLARLTGVLARIRLHEGLLLRQKRISPLDLQSLWQAAQDKQARVDYEAEAGVNFEMHHSPEIVNELMAGVTDAEINAYFARHKNDYQQIGRVNARHITVATQEEADRVVAEIRNGLPFDQAVQKYSLAADKNAEPAGSLGIIERTDKNLPFVKKLALILPANEVSNPFRMLDGKSYEIYWVDRREAEHLPATDESVRSDIRREIAGEKARKQFRETLAALWKAADITLNQRIFDALWVATWPTQ